MTLSILKIVQKILGKKEKKKRPPLWISILFGSLLFGGALWILLLTPFLSPSAENLLPAEGVVFFADFESPSCQNTLGTSFPLWCQKQSELLEKLTGVLPIRAENFANKMVIAAYKNPISKENPLQFVGLFRLKNQQFHKKEEEIVKQLGGGLAQQNSEKSSDVIFEFGEEGNQKRGFFQNGWLIVSDDPVFLSRIQDVHSGSAVSLGEADVFSSSHFPSMGEAFVHGFLTKDFLFPLIPENIASQAEHVFRHASSLSFAVGYSNGTVSGSFDIPLETMNSHFSFSSEEKGISFPSQEKGITLVANHFGKLFQSLTQELEKTDPAFSFFLWGRARALSQDWLGKEIDFENDILPLFEKGMALWYVPKNSLIVAGVGTEDISLKKEKMLAGLKQKAERFIPRIITHTLEDGTQIREIAACTDCISVVSEEIQGGTLDIFSAEDAEGKKMELSLGEKKNVFLIANDTVLAKDILSYDFSSSKGKKSDLLSAEMKNMELPENAKFDFFRDISEAEIHISGEEKTLHIRIAGKHL
ncbi:hypothetical protein IPN35_03240 [Candidatus Peregrinibacteria bacterium]|nr:MAG: hypothetical protein IPN35_03240 [Candidatus Peregrinibacteria bacterium]